METLSQMLEDYRNGERGLPSYDELMDIVTKIEYCVINAQRYLMLRDAELYGGALYVWISGVRNTKSVVSTYGVENLILLSTLSRNHHANPPLLHIPWRHDWNHHHGNFTKQSI